MKERAEYMSPAQKARIPDGTPRRHDLMREFTGVARPGKTAKDRAKRGRVAE